MRCIFCYHITIIRSKVSSIWSHLPVGEPPLRPVSPDPGVLNDVVPPQPERARALSLLELKTKVRRRIHNHHHKTLCETGGNPMVSIFEMRPLMQKQKGRAA